MVWRKWFEFNGIELQIDEKSIIDIFYLIVLFKLQIIALKQSKKNVTKSD